MPPHAPGPVTVDVSLWYEGTVSAQRQSTLNRRWCFISGSCWQPTPVEARAQRSPPCCVPMASRFYPSSLAHPPAPQAYSALLQWLSSRFLVLADYLQHCPPNPDVTNRLLKCYREVFHNRRSRIPHNPLLAQYVTRVLAVVSQRKAPAEGASDVWKAVHKPLYLTLVLLDRVLGGRCAGAVRAAAWTRRALWRLIGDCVRPHGVLHL